MRFSFTYSHIIALLALGFPTGCESKIDQPIKFVGGGNVPVTTPKVQFVQTPATQKTAATKSTAFEFKPFAFSLPERFKLATESDQGDMKINVYKSIKNEKDLQAVVSMTQILDKRAAMEMNKDVGKFLSSFSSGSVKSLKIKIVNRGKPEPIEWNGLRGTQMKLLIKLENQQDAGGVIYGLIHDEKVLTVMHILFEGDAANDMKEMDEHLATLKIMDN